MLIITRHSSRGSYEKPQTGQPVVQMDFEFNTCRIYVHAEAQSLEPNVEYVNKLVSTFILVVI
jgi:hypothetical protein